MSTDSRLPATSFSESGMRSFGSASVRLFAPQLVFEMVRAQTGSPYYGAGTEMRWLAPPAAANENREPPQQTTAA